MCYELYIGLSWTLLMLNFECNWHVWHGDHSKLLLFRFVPLFELFDLTCIESIDSLGLLLVALTARSCSGLFLFLQELYDRLSHSSISANKSVRKWKSKTEHLKKDSLGNGDWIILVFPAFFSTSSPFLGFKLIQLQIHNYRNIPWIKTNPNCEFYFKQ